MSVSLMRFIAIYDHGLSPIIINAMDNLKEIAEMVVSRQKIRLEPEIQKEIQELPEKILYQPGSLRAREAEERFQFYQNCSTSQTQSNPVGNNNKSKTNQRVSASNSIGVYRITRKF